MNQEANSSGAFSMSVTGLDVFDRTLQKTNVWLVRVMEELGLQDRHQAYHFLRVVLHELRDRLPLPQVAHLGAQLPTLLRGVYYDGWRPSLTGSKEHLPEFLIKIGSEVDPSLNLSAETVTKCVLRVLSEKIDIGEIRQIISTMPLDMRALWSDAIAA
jgi:uncharacterized protein (DUF2267 family)